MNHVTQRLVLDYIEKNTNSIIVIVSEVGDPTGDSAINLVMQKAADFRSRTICALTKPDKLRESDDMGKRVALNGSSFTLEDNRFIVLRGKKFKFGLTLIDLRLPECRGYCRRCCYYRSYCYCFCHCHFYCYFYCYCYSF